MKTVRLDQLLVQQGLLESREKARRVVLAGQVRVNGVLATKPGRSFAEDVTLEVIGGARFVSRGGDKLEGAFAQFDLDVRGLVALDVGSSTGGFTDCLLQHGAVKVYAVDVGKGQLHWKLRTDERVVVMEQFNARYLTREDIGEAPQVGVTDVSFISLTKILPAMVDVLAAKARIVALIKPQFEAGREQVGKGGVVRDPEVRLEVVEKIRYFCEHNLKLICLGIKESPLTGPAGNVEYLSYWEKSQ